MSNVRVELRGVESALRKLGQLSPRARKVARREIRKALVNIERGAKQRAPNSPLQPPTKQPSRSRGRLRSSITHEMAPSGLSGRVGTNVEYAPYQEFGTRRIPPRPFLFPAFEEERPAFVQRLARAIDDENRKLAADKAAGEASTE